MIRDNHHNPSAIITSCALASFVRVIWRVGKAVLALQSSKLDESSCGLRDYHIPFCCVSCSPVTQKQTARATAKHEQEILLPQFKIMQIKALSLHIRGTILFRGHATSPETRTALLAALWAQSMPPLSIIVSQ